ncbi:GNAT family N-acetyltransferase [Actinomadura atramentaria]|uniref:GNAT family N-acetyltransferase n=1 Tax=Actinomadura atramentaria TaxID=1990 RepID=UPI00037FD724|nr:GNAT family N-acetyltransferase [Actinomadura atramentaria]
MSEAFAPTAPDDPADPARVLDDPVRAALTGPHARFAERRGAVVRYQADVCPFYSLPADPGPADWADVAALAGPGGFVLLTAPAAPPDGWTTELDLPGVQLTDDGIEGAADPEAVRLTAADVPEILDLVERTRPGPFLQRTVELGNYFGLREDGRLVAMAGERLRPPGWTEISAVCTDPGHRGRGLATRLIRTVVAGVRERGERPFLHAAADNTGAIALYEALGLTLRRRPTFYAVRVPPA